MWVNLIFLFFSVTHKRVGGDLSKTLLTQVPILSSMWTNVSHKGQSFPFKKAWKTTKLVPHGALAGAWSGLVECQFRCHHTYRTLRQPQSKSIHSSPLRFFIFLC
uniref:Secreted protein n=1 Tax=Eutreptiella gymnastica TaxID=73025 RepID=A0A7S1NT46_9EUGL